MRCPVKIKRLVEWYALWLLGIMAIGLAGFFASGYPGFFLAAGFRWLAILHASVGLFVFAGKLLAKSEWHGRIFWLLTGMLALHFLVQVLELMILGWNVLGKARLTGLFQHAAIGANFALACVLVVSVLQGVSSRRKGMLFMLAFFSSLATGTRSASFAILLLVLIRALFSIRRPETRAAFALVAVVVGIAGISAVSAIVDRGNPFLKQFGEGGRIGVFLRTLDRIQETAGVSDILIGKGFGVGTNTGFILAGMRAGDPTVFDWNWLTDNLALPIFFQMGLLGVVVFFGGAIEFFAYIWPRTHQGRRDMIGLIAVIGLMGLAGAPWEHYYLMASYALVLGWITWKELGYANGIGAGTLFARR